MGGHTHTHTHTAAAVQEGGWGWEGGRGVERCMGDGGFVVQEPHASGLLNIFDQLTQKACAYSLTFSSTAKRTKYYLLDWPRIEPHCFFWYKLKCVSNTECYLVSFILIFQIIPDLKLWCQSQRQNKLMPFFDGNGKAVNNMEPPVCYSQDLELHDTYYVWYYQT